MDKPSAMALEELLFELHFPGPSKIRGKVKKSGIRASDYKTTQNALINEPSTLDFADPSQS